jgi:hypothetical protein
LWKLYKDKPVPDENLAIIKSNLCRDQKPGSITVCCPDEDENEEIITTTPATLG